MKHTLTESTEINFAKLEKRLLQINNSKAFHFSKKNLFQNGPFLLVATGGSKAIAYYLKMYFESQEIICEVIEPRDYFYKKNINQFNSLIALSNSGTSNGVLKILKSFPGIRILITGEYFEENTIFHKMLWCNSKYEDREKSFISIIPTLAPMLMILELTILKEEKKAELLEKDLIEINNKLRTLIQKSKTRIKNLNINFKDTNMIQIMSGYDTICSSTILESNMIETGTTSVVVHDKGSFCHGRSNLLFQNPESPMIYLTHQMRGLDNELLTILTQEYPNIFLFHTLDENTSIFWKEYYLALQMYYLSKKIAEDKKIDLTMPEYNPQVVKKIYKYKGEM